MNKLSENEILSRLAYAGKKRTKKLLIKLIKLYGGKPIQHLLDPADGQTVYDGGINWEYSQRQLFGFSETLVENLATGDGKAIYKSITGNMPEKTLINVINIIM